MKKYRILQVHNFYQIPGGEDVVVRNEKRLLTEHGHEVYEYFRSNAELTDKGFLGKLLLPFTAVYSLRTAREVKRLIREKHIDIVHVHNTLTMVSPSVFYAAFRCGVPVVQTLHNFRMNCPAGSYFRDNAICEECVEHGLRCSVRHKCYRGSRIQTAVSAAILYVHRMLGTYRKVNFICLTQFNRDKLLSSFAGKQEVIVPEHVYIKPNFTFVDDAMPDGGWNAAGEYFLFAGRVEALKGIDIAVRAFEQLKEEQLYVAGDGPMMEQMRAYVQEHDIQNVKLLGYLKKEEMSEWFRHAKAVIMSSQWYETFGMSMAEAYSYGVPVIAGRIGNLDGMVEEGVTGLKFTYNSADDLADKVRKFNRLDLLGMKKNAREFYERNFGPKDNYRRLMEIYRAILGERGEEEK